MIVHVITGLGRGGAENAMFRLLSQESDPAQVHVVSLTGGGIFRERLESLGVGVTCLEMHPGLPSPFKWWRLVRLLREWKPQLVQTWMYHADLLGGLAAVMAGVPVCWGIRHSDLSRRGNKATTLLVSRACALLSRHVPARAISCSSRAVEVHRALGYNVPFEIVPNGLSIDWMPRADVRRQVRAEFGFLDADFVFAHAGRKDPQKDHPGLALAFSRLHAIRPNVRLLLAGDGLTPGHAYFDGLPFSPEARRAVFPLGPRDDLSRMWQAADAYVSSSYGEGFPNAVAEAMASGLPCVVTDVGDSAEIVADTGCVVPPSNPEALATAMQELCDMPLAGRELLGCAARQRVLERFTVERMAAGFNRVWNDVIAKEQA